VIVRDQLGDVAAGVEKVQGGGAAVGVGAEKAADGSDREPHHGVHRYAVGAQNASAADFHSRRRCAMSWARSSSFPPSSTWRSEGSARR
jgi:hypothetical protein